MKYLFFTLALMVLLAGVGCTSDTEESTMLPPSEPITDSATTPETDTPDTTPEPIVKDCGSDTQCMDAQFQTCTPAILTLDSGAEVMTYAITGAQTGGCSVVFTYLRHADTSWENVPMTCLFEHGPHFEGAMQATISKAFQDGTGCTGPLMTKIGS